MASGLCAALTGRTHGCTDQPASVKKTLANSEPSTHGTSRTSEDVRPESAKRAKADIDQVAVTNRDFMSESERDDSAGDREQSLLGRRQLGTVIAARK